MSEFLSSQFFTSWDLTLRLKPSSFTSPAKKAETGKYSCMCRAPTVRILLGWSTGTAQNKKHHTPFPSQNSKPGNLGCNSQAFKIFWKLKTTAEATRPPLNKHQLQVMEITKHFLWLLKSEGEPKPDVLVHGDKCNYLFSLSDHFLYIYIHIHTLFLVHNCVVTGQHTLIKNIFKTSSSSLINKSKAHDTVWRHRNDSVYKSTFFQCWKSSFHQLLSAVANLPFAATHRETQWLSDDCTKGLTTQPEASPWRDTGITALLRQQNKKCPPFMTTVRILKAPHAWRCTSRWQAAAARNVLVPKLCQ